MKTLSSYRQRVTNWLLTLHEGFDFEDSWYRLRQEIGRRISTSKRGEIAMLQVDLGDLEAKLRQLAKEVRAARNTAVLADTKAELSSLEVQTFAKRLGLGLVIPTGEKSGSLPGAGK